MSAVRRLLACRKALHAPVRRLLRGTCRRGHPCPVHAIPNPSMKSKQSRHSGRRSGRGSRQSSRPRSESQKAPVPLTFWQKLASFFQFSRRRPGASSNGQHARPAESKEARTSRTVRKLESVDVTSPKLYVGNLSFDASESDLFELFKGIGAVRNAEIVTNKFNEKSKGFGFVTMSSIEEARRAVTELHDKEFLGRKLVVSGAKSQEHETS